MTDTCEIERDPPPGALGELDHATGQRAPVMPEVIYGPGTADLLGRCSFSPERRQGVTVEVGGTTDREKRTILSLPATAPAILKGDRVRWLTTQSDPLGPGTVYVVDEEPEPRTLLLKRTATLVRFVEEPDE